MQAMKQLVLVTIALCLSLQISASWAQPVEKRIGLVIGNAAYQTGALATPANDAGLVAQTLQAAGFDVVGARDLDEESLRHAVRDFVEKVTAAGPQAVVFVYFAGYGLQLEGENYLVPIDAKIERDTDVPVRGLRVYDFVVRTLAATHPKASFIVLDAARTSPFAQAGQPLAGGLALMEPPPGMLIAFNAAPGTVAPDGQGPYGPYAQALAEMMREGGLPVGEMFDRIRLRVSEVTKGAQVPWSASTANRHSFSSNAPPMRRRLPHPLTRSRQSDHDPFAKWRRRRPIPPCSIGTRSVRTKSSSTLIRTMSWPGAPARSSQSVARRLSGAEPASSIPRTLTGHI